ncbi:MAG: hypothetical protein PHQ23_12285 [Candidatus Wallbacteria bacterium]|nr:hypothetical protein [Candidatus Wallbacteria bacterium]
MTKYATDHFIHVQKQLKKQRVFLYTVLFASIVVYFNNRNATALSILSVLYVIFCHNFMFYCNVEDFFNNLIQFEATSELQFRKRASKAFARFKRANKTALIIHNSSTLLALLLPMLLWSLKMSPFSEEVLPIIRLVTASFFVVMVFLFAFLCASLVAPIPCMLPSSLNFYFSLLHPLHQEMIREFSKGTQR